MEIFTLWCLKCHGMAGKTRIIEQQPESYKQEVLPPSCKARLAIEAGVSMGWEKYIGENGRVLCIDHFGASAPYKVLAEKFGFTVGKVCEYIQKLANP